MEVDSDAEITKRTLVLSGSVSDRRYSPGNTDASINLHIGNIATVDYDDGLIKDNLNVEVKASYADENVGTGKPVTIDDVVLTGTHAENYDYELNFDNLTGNILKGLQSAPDVSYDNNGHITGTDSSMEYRYNGGSWETCGNSIALDQLGVYEIRYKETANYEAGAIYKFTYGSGVTDPSEFYVRLNEGKAIEKEYDGTNVAYPSLVYGGIMDEDRDKVKVESYTAEYKTSKVGQGIEVTISNIKLSGEAASKYQPYADEIVLTASGTIKPRTINVHVTANDKDYDGTDTANVYVCGHTSFVNGEDVELKVNGHFESVDAGENIPVVIDGEVTLAGADSGNYVVGTVTPAKMNDGEMTETATLTATIRKAQQKAPDKTLFTVEDGMITGYTGEMEVLLPGNEEYVDCAGLTGGIQIESGNSYVFRYKEDKNHLPGATTTINVGVTATVKITFDLCGEAVKGNYPTTATITTGQRYGDLLMELTPNDPDREFVGWYTDPVAGERVYPDTICSSTKDFILYARFADKVSDRKDGTISVTMSDFTYGNTASAPTAQNITGDYTDYVYYFKEKSAGDGTYTTDIPKLPGEYTVKAVAQRTTAYNQAEATADFTVNKRVLTANITAESREYNGGTACGGSIKVTGGIIQGDDVSIDTSAAKFNFADKNAGTNKEVTATGITLAGEQKDRYELAVGKAYADITPYMLNYSTEALVDGDHNKFTVSVNEKIYDGSTTAVFAIGKTAVSTDDMQIVVTGQFDDANVNPSGNSVTVTNVELAGADAGNYKLSVSLPLTLTGTIHKAANDTHPDISGTNPSLGMTNGRISGLDETMEYSSDGGKSWNTCPNGELTGLSAGEYRVRYKETRNYRASNISIITLKDSSVTEMVTITFYSDGKDVGTTKIPKGSSPANAPEITKDGFTLSGWETLDNTPFVFGETTVDSDLNLYAVWTPVAVEKKDGQIRVSMANGVYGDPLPTPVAENVVGDYISSDYTFFYKGVSDSDFTTEKPTEPGNYTVKAVAKETGAYKAAEATANFTIAKRELSFTLTADSKVYDGTTDVSGYQFNYGNMLEEDSGKISIDKSGAKVSFTDADAGSKTVEGTGFTIIGEKAHCYKLPDRIAGTGEITKKEIFLSFEGVDKDYDANTNAQVNISSDDILEGDSVSFTYTAVFEGSEPGIDKKINISNIVITGTDSGNYSLADTTGIAYASIRSTTAEKNDGKIEVTMNDSVYGDPLSSPAVRNVSGDYQYEDMTFYYAKDGTDDFSTSIPSKPGTYRVRAVAAATQHFNETSAEDVFTIEQRELGISVTADEKVYDGSTLVYGWKYEYTNLLPEDEGRLDIDTSAVNIYFADKNAGQNKQLSVSGFKLTGEAADYYKLPSVISGTGSITQKTIALSFEGIDKVYDGNTDAEVKITPDGVVGNDEISFIYTAGFENADEGTDKTIRVSNIRITGKDAGNYRLSSTTGTTTADITHNDEMQHAYTIRYVTADGTVLDTQTGMAADGAVVRADKEITGYEYAGTPEFTVDQAGANVFDVTCTAVSYTLTIVKEVEGVRETVREISYTIEDTVRANGNAGLHEDYVGYTGDWFDGMRQAVNLNTWTVELPAKSTGDHTAVLIFKMETPAIRFDANGGTGEMENIYAEDIQSGDTLESCTFENPGYIFAGWALSADGPVVYADGQALNEVDYSGNITLYAVWEAQMNTIRFDLNGGTSLTHVPDSIQVRTGDPYPALPTVVSSDSSNPFIGWYTQDGIQVREGDICQGETVLYAHYGIRSEGRVEISARNWEYGNEPDVTVNIVDGDYEQSDISYQYRGISGNEWISGLPADPGEYMIRVTAAATEDTLGTTAQCRVTVNKRSIKFHVEGTGKVYDGNQTAPVTIVIENSVEGDEVCSCGSCGI